MSREIFVFPEGLPEKAGRGTWVLRLTLAYAFLAAVLAISVYWGGDKHNLPTLLLYSPQWPFLVPPALLGVWALFRRRSMLPVNLVVIAGWLFFPMGLNLPLAQFRAAPATGVPVKLVTCNLGGGADVSQLVDYCTSELADIVVCQEAGSQTEAPFESQGWQVSRAERLMVCSKHGIVGPIDTCSYKRNERDLVAAALWRVVLKEGPVQVVVVHLPTPRHGLEPVLKGGPSGLKELTADIQFRTEVAWLVSGWLNKIEGDKIIAGDFNMPSQSSLEREAFADYRDAHRDAGWWFGNTKRTRWHGLRIDHVLGTSGVQFLKSQIVPTVGGDHVAVSVDCAVAPLPAVEAAEDADEFSNEDESGAKSRTQRGDSDRPSEDAADPIDSLPPGTPESSEGIQI